MLWRTIEPIARKFSTLPEAPLMNRWAKSDMVPCTSRKAMMSERDFATVSENCAASMADAPNPRAVLPMDESMSAAEDFATPKLSTISPMAAFARSRPSNTASKRPNVCSASAAAVEASLSPWVSIWNALRIAHTMSCADTKFLMRFLMRVPLPLAASESSLCSAASFLYSSVSF